MPKRVPAIVLLATALSGLAAASTPAAPTATDLVVGIGAGATPVPVGIQMAPRPNGTTAAIAGLRLYAMPVVQSAGPDAARFSVSFELSEGLRFVGGPDRNAGECVTTETKATCTTASPLPPSAFIAYAPQWEIAATAYGRYTLRAQVFDESTPDVDPSSNTAQIQVALVPPAPAASASAVKLVPARPRAGVAVTASVVVRAGTVGIRPSNVACRGSIGTAKIKGTPRAALGVAECAYRTRRSARGKTLRGAVSLLADGRPFTKRFSARLR